MTIARPTAADKLPAIFEFAQELDDSKDVPEGVSNIVVVVSSLMVVASSIGLTPVAFDVPPLKEVVIGGFSIMIWVET